MFSRTLTFARRHTIAVAALFIALGGTSYAAGSTLASSNVDSNIVLACQAPSHAKGAGVFVIVKSFAQCPSGYLHFSWSKTGPAGNTGPQGNAGLTGNQGLTGSIGGNGAAGLQGFTGLTGATGDIGAAGSNGDNGATGDVGAAGSNGSDGATGHAGVAGSNGSNGATGAAGSNGSDGIQGPQGPQGDTGNAGSNGSDGATGPAGATGATGADSTVAGPVGATGPQGPGAISFTTTESSGNSDIISAPNGLQVGYGCYGEVTIDINSVEGTLQLSGTQTLGSTLSAVDDNEIPSNGGPNNDDNQYSFIPVASSVDLNVVAGNNGIFNDFTIHGEENGSTCTFWSVTTPAS